MNATTDPDNWYLARDGKQHGPLSDVEMTKLVELGHLRATDLVWRPGFADWRPAPSVFPSAAEPTPPARPAPAPAAAPVAAAAAMPANQSAAAAAASAWPQSFAPAGPAPVAEAAAPFQPMESAGGAPGQMRIDTRPFMPAPASGRPDGSPAQRPQPTPLGPAEMVPSSKRGVVVPLIALAVIGGGAFAAYTYRDAVQTTLVAIRDGAPATDTSPVPVVKAPETAEKAAPPEASTTAAAPAAAPVVTPSALTAADLEPLDAKLAASPAWALLKRDYPEWYNERLKEAAQMTRDGKPDSAVDAKLVEGVIALRRQNAKTALAASPAGLTSIAKSFIDSLTAMQAQSVNACYGFISKGEATAEAMALIQKPTEGAALHAQLQAVFAAVAEGKAQPVARAASQKSDYDLLAIELGAIGWSQSDIKLFADANALAEAPREKVCTMVRDWFAAQLAIKDEAAKERLLFETLRPVVAG